MNTHKKLRWWLRSFVKETRRGKYKAVTRYFWDRKYRKNINHLMDILCWGKLKMEEGYIRLEDIYHSHEINYPEWVETLVQQMQDEHSNEPLPPMKVLWDYEKDRWIVVDGNHRLEAYRRVKECGFIKVNMLYRPDHPELNGFRRRARSSGALFLTNEARL